VKSQYLILRFQRQQRILPAAAVKELVEERAAEMEKASGSPLHRAEKQLLKGVAASVLPFLLLGQANWRYSFRMIWP
jgi:DNA recombination-dependent growth factor C